jgi:NAD(P)-dependent dehydrogenase (short-subunit alcohol dehydrogenase family)
MSDEALRDRFAVITGASRGFGQTLARAFARAGASLLLSARNQTDLTATRNAILDEVPGCRIELFAADLSEQIGVRELAEAAAASFGRTDVLVCNAGMYGPKGPVESVDWNSWVQTIAVNLYGPVLCAREFAPLLKRAGRAKVILLSGGGATKGLPFLSAYAASKAAVVRFGETLAEEWQDDGIDVNMLAPGAMNTGMLDEILQAGPATVGEAYYAASLKQKESGGASMERAAALGVFLASAESDGITGKLISAVWDPWERLARYKDALRSSDVYTLRRIVPKERGLDW